MGEDKRRNMKVHVQQRIRPVSVFGLGFLLLIMGLSGVASIQETRHIHQQILAVEDNYRHIENLVEGIRANSSQVTPLLRDRLLESKRTETDYSGQLAQVRSKTDASPKQLSALRRSFPTWRFNACTSLIDRSLRFRDGLAKLT